MNRKQLEELLYQRLSLTRKWVANLADIIIEGGGASGGTSGYSGYSGKSGYSGYSGGGTSGYSGYSGAAAVSSYLVYKAFLNQTGTSDPVATVLQNTLGSPVVWTRSGLGTYIGTCTGAFTFGKTIIIPYGATPSIGDSMYMMLPISSATIAYVQFSTPTEDIVKMELFSDLNYSGQVELSALGSNVLVYMEIFP